MLSQAIAFVDAGYLRRGGERALALKGGTSRVDAGALVTWLATYAAEQLDEQLLRVYWYDGAHAPDHPQYAAQRRYFDAIAATPGLQLRLGHMQERTEPWQPAVKAAVRRCGVTDEQFAEHFTFRSRYEQKGVDTLLVLDLVRHAQSNAYDAAILITGDRDIAEAVRTAQDYGRRVVLVHPPRAGAAVELRQLADWVDEIDRDALLRIMSQPILG